MFASTINHGMLKSSLYKGISYYSYLDDVFKFITIKEKDRKLIKKLIKKEY